MDMTESHPPEITRGHAVACGAILAVALLLVGAWIGMELCERLCKAAIAAKPLETRPVVQNPPPPLFACRDRAEWGRVCKGRARSGMVGL